MKWLIALALILACAPTHAVEDFPEVEEMPSRPGLPDPLVMLNGTRITSNRAWFNKRAPELRALFQHYEYGYFPKAPKVKGTLRYVDTAFFGGKATLKLVRLSFGPKAAPDINLMVVLPNAVTKPVPVFVGVNFRGNHSLVTNTSIPLPTAWMPSKYEGVLNNHAIFPSRGC